MDISGLKKSDIAHQGATEGNITFLRDSGHAIIPVV
jgi:hypothetical protein